MKCSDLHQLLLRRRIAAIDVSTSRWQHLRAEVGLPPGVGQQKCLERMLTSGMLRRLKRGLYSVVDPARQVPAIAVASAAHDQRSHYITTDAALSFHGAIDQPVPEIVVTVVRGSELTPFLIGSQKVRESGVSQAAFDLADHYGTTVDGYKVDIASRVQAVVDALDAPSKMTHFSLLSEVLRTFDQGEVNAVVKGAIGRSRASAQRLGFLLEDARVPMPNGLTALAPSAAVELRPGQRSGLFSTRWRVYA